VVRVCSFTSRKCLSQFASGKVCYTLNLCSAVSLPCGRHHRHVLQDLFELEVVRTVAFIFEMKVPVTSFIFCERILQNRASWQIMQWNTVGLLDLRCITTPHILLTVPVLEPYIFLPISVVTLASFSQPNLKKSAFSLSRSSSQAVVRFRNL